MTTADLLARLDDALTATRAEQHRLSVRAYHLHTALRRARMGVDEGVIAAELASKGIIVLAEAVPA